MSLAPTALLAAVLAAAAPACAQTNQEPPAASQADPAEPVSWEVRIEAPGALRELLARHLDVVRFQRDAKSEPIARAELARLVAATPAQVAALLETEGYFEPSVKARIEPGTPLIVHVEVQPGEQVTVSKLRFEVQGELAERAESGERAAAALMAELRAEWSLPIGAPFKQDAWNAAKAATLARLRAQAYPLASWSGTAAQVDAQSHGVYVFVVADSGPQVSFGAIQVEGLSRYEEEAVRNLAPFSPGMPYSEKLLLDFQERLARAGLFDSVAVVVEPTPEDAAATPVLVRLRELPRQQATVGVGISADSGPRLTFEHLHRRPFGLDWHAKTKLELGRDKRAIELDFVSHPQPGLYRNLASASAAREEASTLIVRSQKLRVGRTQDTERIERLYYLEWQRATVDTSGLVDRSAAVTANYEWVWRRLDNILLPTRGYATSFKLGAGRSFATSGDLDTGSGWFGRAVGRLTGYLPLGAAWYSQARLEAAQVFANTDVSVPFTLLFRAGGDNSVRGYSYQSLGPTREGVAVGGRVLATGSFELARPFSARLPAWWGALFVDAGNAADDWNSLHAALGYGVGLRWRSPVGPLNVDLAYGHELRKFRLHFNVGITF